MLRLLGFDLPLRNILSWLCNLLLLLLLLLSAPPPPPPLRMHFPKRINHRCK
jgi:hypothetical protein